MAVKCYFSGVESGQHYQHCLDAKVKHCLMSYWQFRDKDPDIIKKRKLANPHVEFMVDSGAHTFITDWKQFTTWTRKQFDDYVEEYVNWIRRNRKYISCAVEFDIDLTLNMVLAKNQNASLGTTVVEGWQKAHFMPLQKLGIDIVYVWHQERKMDGWEEMCSKFDYVGLPGFMSSEKDFNKFISVARRYNSRIHGFAATKQNDFRDIPWYSIDSITWKSPEMWGTFLVWDERNQRFRSGIKKPDRIHWKQHIKNEGFDPGPIIADTNYKLATKFGLHQMRKMEAFYEERFKDRTFYYEIRLPHRDVIQTWTGREIMSRWETMRGEDKFIQHTGLDAQSLREILITISAVQNADSAYLANSQKALTFLGAYFPSLVNPLVSDMKVFQQELSNFLAPPNPPALHRTEIEHYEPIRVYKQRDEEIDLDELEPPDPADSILARLL